VLKKQIGSLHKQKEKKNDEDDVEENDEVEDDIKENDEVEDKNDDVEEKNTEQEEVINIVKDTSYF
jgi:hypothetical protein